MEFVSEQIQPLPGTFDAGAMARGEPGLPQGFTWRDAPSQIIGRISQWKATSPEGGRADGEVYLRRHYFKLRMSDGSAWTVYFLRQPPGKGASKNRWYLYGVEPAGQTEADAGH